MARVKQEDFTDFDLEYVDILEEGDEYDSCWGVSFITLTEEKIEALRAGKVLYWNDGEYATLVRLI